MTKDWPGLFVPRTYDSDMCLHVACTVQSVQTFDFLTLYMPIKHNLMKSGISILVHNTVRKKTKGFCITESVTLCNRASLISPV